MARYFLYLAPEWQDKMSLHQVRLNEPGPGRHHLVDELGVPEPFLDWAEPGDFYVIEEGGRLVIRLGRNYDDDPQDDKGTPT